MLEWKLSARRCGETIASSTSGKASAREAETSARLAVSGKNSVTTVCAIPASANWEPPARRLVQQWRARALWSTKFSWTLLWRRLLKSYNRPPTFLICPTARSKHPSLFAGPWDRCGVRELTIHLLFITGPQIHEALHRSHPQN